MTNKIARADITREQANDVAIIQDAGTTENPTAAPVGCVARWGGGEQANRGA